MPDESVNSSTTYVIKTNQGRFKIKAPKDTPRDQVIAQAVSKSPKFAQVYPSIQAHAKMKDFASKTIQPVSDEGPIAKDPVYKGLKDAASAPGPQATTPSAIAQTPSWYGRSARYLGGELVGLDNAVIGAAAGSYKLLHDVTSAVDPTDKEDFATRASRVGTDVKGAGTAVKDAGSDIGHGIWNLLSMHPEAAADPVAFGQKVGNAAMVVDGGIKMTEGLAKSAGLAPDQISEALRVGNNLTNGKGGIFAKTKALEDAYVHTKGIDIAKKVTDASKAVNEEVKLHSKALSDQIDKGVPTGVVDAAVEAKKIADTFSSTVQTGDRFNPALGQAFKDATATAPGQWTFEKARQFRSSIGRAMSKESGPQRAVLTDVYKDLTNKLGATAKKYKMENSWNHYNELEKKYTHEFGDIIDDIRDAKTGKEVAGKLSKNTAFTGELVNNLQRYGLDRTEVLRYVKDADRIAKSQGKYGSLFRLAYGTPLGLAGVIGGHAVGAGWIGSMAAGATLGYASSGLINLARSLKLSPDVIETILKSRELPGKMPVDIGNFPTATTTPPAPQQLPSPQAQFQANNPGSNVTATPQSLQPTAQVNVPVKKQLPPPSPQAQQKTQVAPQATPPKETPTAPAATPASTTVAPLGQHGTGRMAKLAKKAEGMAASREKGRRTAAQEAKEAQDRAIASNVDVNSFGIPELEDVLKEKNKVGLSALQKWRRANPNQTEEYMEALKFLVIEQYEKDISKSSGE